MQVDTSEVRVAPGDRFLLCSDGLHSHFDDAGLARMLGQQQPLDKLVAQFIDTANKRGGHDNITALLVESAA